MAPATSSQRLVDVRQQLLALVADAAADDGGAGRDVLGLQDAGHAGGGDDDRRRGGCSPPSPARRCARR